MTLRIGPRSGKRSHRRSDKLPMPVPPGFDDKLTANEACPHCQRDLTEYRFTTGDGLLIITYHCAEHDDVIPLARHHHA